MFSGDTTVLDKDEDGKIFLDREPKFFKFILSYIRSDGEFSQDDLE